MNLHPFLADLEKRINPEEENRLEREWLTFVDLQLNEGVFSPARTPQPSALDWPKVPINDGIEDSELMIYTQLRAASEVLAGTVGELMCYRSNYGTAIIPSMFGAEIFMMPRSYDTLPGSRTLPGGRVGVLSALEKAPDFSLGFAGRVFETAERFLKLLEGYPKVKRYMHRYNPDLQGPFSLCDALWGCDIYLDMYDHPKDISAAMSQLTDVYLAFTRKWKALCPDFDKQHAIEWGMLHRGGVILRNDSAMNISGEMYRELVWEHDARIMAEFGGGVHFCGKGDHYLAHVCRLPNLSATNLSQPEYNHMETVFRETVDRDILLIGLNADAAQVKRPMRGRVHSHATLGARLAKERN